MVNRFGTRSTLLVAVLLISPWPEPLSAAVTWSFNWYCSGCARLGPGARTTGTNGPFNSREACDRARAGMQSTMDSRGGGVRTESCQSSGVDIDHSRSSPSGPTQSGAVQRPPQSAFPQPLAVDPFREQEARRREDEERERRAAEERRRAQEEFARGRDRQLPQERSAFPSCRVIGLPQEVATINLIVVPAAP